MEDLSMAVIEMSIKEMEYERLKAVLENLKGLAESVDRYEDDIFEDYRQIARSDMQEIIDTLLELEI